MKERAREQEMEELEDEKEDTEGEKKTQKRE